MEFEYEVFFIESETWKLVDSYKNKKTVYMKWEN